jgi:type II restriction/modification system DNA methylase subunit YeeA
MSQPDGIFGEHTIKYFNGGLFDTASIIQLDRADLGILYEVSKNYDWSHIAPAIFGTLFERSLDPARRSLIGAHYTSEEDIRLLIEPVLMRPLQERWTTVRQQILEALEVERAEEAARNSRQARLRTDLKSEKLLATWIDELTSIRVLDPACGSGNFLYVALRRMLDLWLEATRFASEQGISLVVPKMVSPRQLFGIETEFYAHELASIVVWIGFLQWRHEHGVIEDREPILQKLANIEHADAILQYDSEGAPYEPEWPKSDFIVGNPPFLGGSDMRGEMNQFDSPKYVDDLRTIYLDRVPGGANLVTYWFEKARAYIEPGISRRAGLIATQAIRNGLNREILKKIDETCSIFYAWSDREWINAGANVRISMIGFDSGQETYKTLDGSSVGKINPNLTSGLDLTSALRLHENRKIGFKGFEKNGQFELTREVARKMLSAPTNPNGRDNDEVVKPWSNGDDVNGRPRGMYIIDFGLNRPVADAALFELPFQWVQGHVYDERQRNNDRQRRNKWWLFGRSGEDLRNATLNLSRLLVTPRVSKHRCFAWLDGKAIADSRLFVFARSDDYFFGVLHSRVHELWALATSSRHGEATRGVDQFTMLFHASRPSLFRGLPESNHPKIRTLASRLSPTPLVISCGCATLG